MDDILKRVKRIEFAVYFVLGMAIAEMIARN